MSRGTCSPIQPRTLHAVGKVCEFKPIAAVARAKRKNAGVANYLNLKTPDGKTVTDAAWYYPDCKVSVSLA
jgi:hypothetical protein